MQATDQGKPDLDFSEASYEKTTNPDGSVSERWTKKNRLVRGRTVALTLLACGTIVLIASPPGLLGALGIGAKTLGGKLALAKLAKMGAVAAA